METPAVDATDVATVDLGPGAQDRPDRRTEFDTPSFSNALINNLVRARIFDRLLHVDGNGQLVPGLAESWQSMSDSVWEFRLRSGIVYHDGRPLTPCDVAFSIDRAYKVPNSPNSFAMSLSYRA